LQRTPDLADPERVQDVMKQTLINLGIDPESFDRTVRADGGSAIGDLFRTDAVGDAARARHGLSAERVYAAGTQSILQYSEQLKIAALTDPTAFDKSLGVTINRTISANFLAAQLSKSDELIDTARARSDTLGSVAENILKDKTAISGIVAPSDFVDLIKQMTGMTRVKKLATISDISTEAGKIEMARQRSAYEAIAKYVNEENAEAIGEGRMVGATADTLHDYSISPAAIAKANLEQQTKELARQRAIMLSLGTTADDLPGFDPMTMDKGGRLIKDDIIRMKDVMLKEQKRVLEQLRGAGADVTSLESSINELQSANFDQVKQILRMGKNLIPEYGSVTTAHKIAMEGKDALSSASIKPTRSLMAQNRAVAHPRYVEDAASFLRTKKIRSLFNELKQLEKQLENLEIKKPVGVLTTQAREVKIAIRQEVARGLRVISDIHSGPGVNVLDIVDTIEAELQSQFGGNAHKFMQGFGLEGEEDLMISLQLLAERRRLARSVTYDSRARGLVSAQLDMIRIPLPSTPDLMDVTPNQARDLLKGIPMPYDPSRTYNITDENLRSYLELIADEDPSVGATGEKRTSATRLASEAYAERRRIMADREIAQETTDIMERMGRALPLDPSEAAELTSEMADEIPRPIGEVIDVARSPYRRISEMLRDNASSLRRLVDTRGFKATALGTMALIAGSFIYQNRKNKDHTQDAVTGPPLMPGGNPYEQGYPELNFAQQDSNIPNRSIAGMQYRINTTGSMQDLNRLRGLFGDVVDGPINATMYDGLPMAGQDPYPDLASRF